MTALPDVSIVGGGPAGAFTAYRTLQENPDLHVAIYDARDPIGKPVNCAGGIVTFWLDKLAIKLPDHVVKGPIRGLRIVGPDRKEWTHHQDDIGEDKDIGYVMDRQAFDQWNLDRARKAGAEIHLGMNPGLWSDRYRFPGSRYVIGADGWHSALATHYGFDTEIADHDMHIGYEHRVICPEYDQDYISFYMADRWAPEGYVWVFPEGGNIVKVGLGIPKTFKTDGFEKRVAVFQYLRQFLDDFPEFDGERTEKISSGSGMIPTSRPMNPLWAAFNAAGERVKPRKMGEGGFEVAVVGDAGRMVDPLHGGGISTAMLAARWIGKAMGEGLSLAEYQRWWDVDQRPELMRRYAMKEALTEWKDPELLKLVRALGDFSFESSQAPVEAAKMILHVVKKEPKMFGKAVITALRSYASATY